MDCIEQVNEKWGKIGAEERPAIREKKIYRNREAKTKVHCRPMSTQKERQKKTKLQVMGVVEKEDNRKERGKGDGGIRENDSEISMTMQG